MSQDYSFPKGFLWGAATSAYQIEGAVNEDGRGESIWDVFSHTPGKIRQGDTGDVAADHYHRWKADVALMKEVGLQSYRFSIAWPRVLPQGRGKVNEAGLAFYDRLTDELLAAGITPLVTLFHWDVPTALPGAWLERGTAEAFAEYTEVVSRRLGDRVKLWTTLNEPFCAAFLGYAFGDHAPGERNQAHALRAGHHLLLAHGLSARVIRSNVRDAVIGQAVNPTVVHAHTDSAADQYARRFYDGFANRWLLDPVYGRGYPADMLANYQKMGVLPEGPDFIQPGDMEVIATPIDLLGLNYYSRTIVEAVPGHEMEPGQVRMARLPGCEVTDFGWEVYPQGLFELLETMYQTYHPARLFVLENGASYGDGPDAAGRVRDERRISYMQRHLAQVARAIEAGIPVSGYFAWSLLDNFEWAEGYGQRFGLVHVDFATQKRTIKDSGYFYRKVIEENSVSV